MGRIVLGLFIVLSTGCFGSKILNNSPPQSSPVPNVVESFETVDIDQNGTIEREEYYSSAVSINTDQPTEGLAWIILAVIICTFGSAILYRFKKCDRCKESDGG